MNNPILQLQQQRLLLEIEYNHEKEEFRKQTQSMGIERKTRRGDAWFPVSIGRNYYNSLNQMVVEVTRQPGSDIEHNFEPGRPVCFFTMKRDADGHDAIHYMSFTATVSYAEQDRMVVALPDSGRIVDLQRQEALGIQLFFDETSYRLMFDALDRVIRAKTGRLAALRDIFYTKAPASHFTFDVPVLPWLNASQQEAVNDVLCAKDVLIVHGPPGTGKTTTLVEAIDEVLRREPQVMVCAQSNTAVDWISKQLADRGIQVLRIGNPTRVTDEMLAFCYERRFEAHPDYPQLWQIRRDIRQLYSLPRKGRNENFHQKIARLRERAEELEIRIREDLFNMTRVVACTLAGAAHPILKGWRCHTLFIDEAAQALEAACWIAIPKADRVIFAGDHCQLPPTVKNPECLRAGLGKTLMETIAEQKPEAVRLLNVQYRMNEELMKFSSEWFYGGKLQAAPGVKHRSIIEEVDSPLVWINVSGDQEHDETVREDRDGESLFNREEAEYAIAALHLYIEKVSATRVKAERIDFGVISPYKAQVRLLRQLLKRDSFLKPFRRHISVNTVDAFQGQERDVMILSMVRANEKGQIGFLADLRRMNVAITRARYKVIIVGNATTLCRHRFYRTLYARCHHIG